MKNIIYHYMGILCLVLLGGLSACKEETVLSGQAERVPITLAGEIDQLALTRVELDGISNIKKKKGNRLAVARQYAGYHALAAYGLGRFLAVLITLNGLYRDSFHNTFVF